MSRGSIVIAGILIPAGKHVRFFDAGGVHGRYRSCRIASRGDVGLGAASGKEHGEHAHNNENGQKGEDLFF